MVPMCPSLGHRIFQCRVVSFDINMADAADDITFFPVRSTLLIS